MWPVWIEFSLTYKNPVGAPKDTLHGAWGKIGDPNFFRDSPQRGGERIGEIYPQAGLGKRVFGKSVEGVSILWENLRGKTPLGVATPR